MPSFERLGYSGSPTSGQSRLFAKTAIIISWACFCSSRPARYRSRARWCARGVVDIAVPVVAGHVAADAWMRDLLFLE